MQTQVVGVGRRPARAQPRGPPQTPRAIERQSWDLFLPKNQPDIPIQLEREIKPDPVDQLRELRAAGEKIDVLRQRERAQTNPELVLAVPDTFADHRAGAEHS